ncbi:Peptidase S24/S26A/S26B, conserved region protein [Alicycliphilus denitrificans BC]|nr:Peptidase S24/S26A/S26B, conserved region protein [Alicycliphilus denitrificans BC]
MHNCIESKAFLHYALMHSPAMDGRTFLKAVMDARGLNPHALGAKSGNPSLQSTVHRYLERKVNEPRRATLQPLADFLQVDVAAFFDADKARAELARLGLLAGPREESNITEGPAIRGLYPLISEVQAGMWTELCDNFARGDAEDWLPSTKDLGECGYMLRVRGKSMENPGARLSFPEGMVLHVRAHLDAVPGDFVIVRREGTGEATFKKFVMIDGHPYLEAINPDWPKELKYLPMQPGDVWCGVVVDASLGGLSRT